MVNNEKTSKKKTKKQPQTKLEQKKEAPQSTKKIGERQRLLALGLSKTAAGRIMHGEFTEKEYFEKLEREKKWEEEAERLSKIYNVGKGTILRHLLPRGISIEKYLERGRLMEEVKVRSTLGDDYIKECIEKKMPTLLVCYNNKWRIGLINKLNTYELNFYNFRKKEAMWIAKIDIKFCCNIEKGTNLKEFYKIDETIKEGNVDSKGVIKDKYRISEILLKKASEEKFPVRIVLEEGEIFEGLVRWSDIFHIKLELTPDIPVMIFRHAVCDFEVISN